MGLAEDLRLNALFQLLVNGIHRKLEDTPDQLELLILSL